MSSNLARRITVAVIGIPAALGVVYVGGWVLSTLLAVLAGVGASEVYRLAGRAGVRAIELPGYAAAALFPFVAFLAAPGGLGLDPIVLALAGPVWVMLVMASAMARRGPADRPLAAVAVTVFGALYAGALPAFLVLLRHPRVPLASWGATWLVFLPLAVVWICDTLAMAGGSLLGGPKLAPTLSPNKTWSGAISGTVGAAVAAPVYGAVVLSPAGVSVGLWQLVVFGVVVSALGQVGDVAESLFKREVGAKDSGTFFPGHGGVLDRFDSLYWAIPVSALLLTVFGVL